MAKRVFYPENVQKIGFFRHQSFFKLQTSMIAQIDRKKILSHFYILHIFWLPTKIQKLPKRDFLPQKCPKIEKFLKSVLDQFSEIYVVSSLYEYPKF